MPSRFEQNLAALRAIDSALADRIAALPAASPRLEVKPAANGMPTARAESGDGAWVQVHSRVDPVDEARKFAQAFKPGDDDCYAVAGLGLGYPVFEVLTRIPRDRWVLLIDSREDQFRAAMEHVDWTPVWSRPKTLLFVGTDYSRFLDLVSHILQASGARHLTVIRHPVSHRIDGALYQRMSEDMQRAIVRRKVEITTLVKYAERLEENAIFNLPQFARSAGASDLAGALANVPAYLVAAGPSLNDAIPHLREIQDRALIIAVDKCTKYLLREGIRPDLTTLLDMTPATLEFYKDFPAEDPPGLVFDPDAYFETVDRYPGPRVTFETVVAWTRWAGGLVGTKGLLEKGISVAHTAFNFLIPLGVRPIVFVGVDLAFPGETTHAAGVVMNWGGAVQNDNPENCWVPSVTGGRVRSILGFQSFITLFEVLIGKLGARVINTSPAGALIRGAENRPMAEAIREARTDPGVAQRVRDLLRRPREGALEPLRAGCRRLAEELRAMETICADAEPLSRRIAKIDPTNKLDAAEFNRLATRLNDLRKEVLAHGPILPLLQRTIATEGLMMQELERMLRTVDRGNLKELTALQRRQMELFFHAYGKSVKFTADRLDTMLRRVS